MEFKYIHNFNVEIYVLKDNVKNLFYLFIAPCNINDKIINKQKYISKIRSSIQLVSQYAFVKLKLIGIGYKIFLKDYKDTKILHLKVRYSHNIYFPVPLDFNIKLSNDNMLFIAGFSKNKIFEFATYIRSFKAPEPYKGKGIRYEKEKVTLKVGKKV